MRRSVTWYTVVYTLLFFGCRSDAVARQQNQEAQIERLIHAMKEDSSARDELERIGKPAVEPLLHALRDTDSEVRWNAAFVLREIKDTRAVEPLILCLSDRDGWVRYYAAVSLGKFGDTRAVEPLIIALRNRAESIELRAEYVAALGQIRDKRAIPALEEAWRSKDASLHEAAVLTLAQFDATRSVYGWEREWLSPVRLGQDTKRYAIQFQWRPGNDGCVVVWIYERTKQGPKLRLMRRWNDMPNPAGFGLIYSRQARLPFLFFSVAAQFPHTLIWSLDSKTFQLRKRLEILMGDTDPLARGKVIEHSFAHYVYYPIPRDLEWSFPMHRSWYYRPRQQRFVAGAWKRGD